MAETTTPSIYLSHMPPYGYLDRGQTGEAIGHRPLCEHLRRRGWPEVLVLCGHVQESFGSLDRGETLIVNAACRYALLEWTLGTTRILAQDRLRADAAEAAD